MAAPKIQYDNESKRDDARPQTPPDEECKDIAAEQSEADDQQQIQEEVDEGEDEENDDSSAWTPEASDSSSEVVDWYEVCTCGSCFYEENVPSNAVMSPS